MRFAGGLLGLGIGGGLYYQAHLLAPLRIGVKDAQSDLVEIEYYGRGGIRAVPLMNSAFKFTGLQGGQPPQTYFGGIFKECNSRWWIDKTLFTEADLGTPQKQDGQKNIRGIVELDARATVEEDVYGLVDSLMGTTVIMSIRKDGPAQGAATGFLEVDWVGNLVPGQRYKLSAECTKMKGRDYFPTAELTDKDGKVVRRYRSRFVKVEWPLAINIEKSIPANDWYYPNKSRFPNPALLEPLCVADTLRAAEC